MGLLGKRKWVGSKCDYTDESRETKSCTFWEQVGDERVSTGNGEFNVSPANKCIARIGATDLRDDQRENFNREVKIEVQKCLKGLAG